jgi:hypothetical protein
MKAIIIGLLIGLSVGYWQGYSDAKIGRPNIAVRTLNSFGVAKIKAAQDAAEKRTEEASRP